MSGHSNERAPPGDGDKGKGKEVDSDAAAASSEWKVGILTQAELKDAAVGVQTNLGPSGPAFQPIQKGSDAIGSVAAQHVLEALIARFWSRQKRDSTSGSHPLGQTEFVHGLFMEHKGHRLTLTFSAKGSSLPRLGGDTAYFSELGLAKLTPMVTEMFSQLSHAVAKGAGKLAAAELEGMSRPSSTVSSFKRASKGKGASKGKNVETKPSTSHHRRPTDSLPGRSADREAHLQKSSNPSKTESTGVYGRSKKAPPDKASVTAPKSSSVVPRSASRTPSGHTRARRRKYASLPINQETDPWKVLGKLLAKAVAGNPILAHILDGCLEIWRSLKQMHTSDSLRSQDLTRRIATALNEHQAAFPAKEGVNTLEYDCSMWQDLCNKLSQALGAHQKWAAATENGARMADGLQKPNPRLPGERIRYKNKYWMNADTGQRILVGQHVSSQSRRAPNSSPA